MSGCGFVCCALQDMGKGEAVMVLAKVDLRLREPYCIVSGIGHVPWTVEHTTCQLNQEF